MGGNQHGAGKLAWLGLLLAVLTGKSPLEAADLCYPESVSRFELSTRQELLYSHWLRPLIQSDDSSDWKWPKEFVNTTGRWAAAFVDSQRILEATLDGCPVEGQPALEPVNRLVADCAKLLEIPQPAVVVRSDPYPRAYVVLVADRPHLVLTSSLLDLYEEIPDQLRFVVGRELGRIKCDGLKLRQVSYGLMTILGRIDDQVIPAEARTVLLTYAVGRFLTWSREAEISADRAGLFCCGSPQTAYEALLRQLHGLKADSLWIDPDHSEFHPEAVIRSFRNWEQEPVVAAIRYLHGQSPDSPYVAERLAALKVYVGSGQYAQVLNRRGKGQTRAITSLSQLELSGLAPRGQGVYAYVKAYVGDQCVLTTPTAPYGSVANFERFRTTLSDTAGEPIFFEIWNDGRVYDELLGGFVVYPELPNAANAGAAEPVQLLPIHWDWNDRSKLSHAGLASVKLQIVPIP